MPIIAPSLLAADFANLLAGPIRFRFSITTGVEYNDNINLAERNKQEDVIIRPQFNINAIWPLTQLNTLRLDLGIGYAFYLNHSEFNNNAILISPGSQLSFDIFVGDFRINLHDRFSLSDDPADESFTEHLRTVFGTAAAHNIKFPNPYTGSASTNCVYVARRSRK